MRRICQTNDRAQAKRLRASKQRRRETNRMLAKSGLPKLFKGLE